jgi:starch synthase
VEPVTHVLLASAELSPLVNVGGLAAAVAGLIDGLRRADVQVTVVIPDYFDTPMIDEVRVPLTVPEWAGPAVARRGEVAGVGDVVLVSVPGIQRAHAYVDADGVGWADNDQRFFAFSAAVAALVDKLRPDVVHLNDWHTATTIGHLGPGSPPVVLTIHTLGYQGQADPGWVEVFAFHGESFLFEGACNPLAGGIRVADVVVAVSPTYAAEIITPAGGFGVDGLLRQRGDRLVGIRNGIDTGAWDPVTDPFLPARFDEHDLTPKAEIKSALLDEMGLPELESNVPLIVMVTRLVDQKGVDLALAIAPFLESMPAQFAVLGSGDRALVDMVADAARQYSNLIAFRHGFDNGLAHRMIAGGDLFMMPSRFEPCGLAQMQAMRYGTLPIVTDVGGLHDTVIDIDLDRVRGTGVRAAAVTESAVVDATHRAVRAWSHPARRTAMRRRGMIADWSWDGPAAEHIVWYERVIADQGDRQ